MPKLPISVVAYATVELTYEDEEFAQAVAKSLAPDNIGLPKGLSICTQIIGKKLKIRIVNKRGLESTRATIDDLISSVQVAERVIKLRQS